ncbi:glycosyltransferase [Pseudidiomarina taiwanensis]|uniref:Glycosyl transferase family 1 domain-containing protein n=1 Tax=Pseudidiomarina taiwanensis TaxID=337250 RepID=A0A432ZKH3_9GAMM|nr:glycosyltransferase [Pseudidiomarina taiwanensis]RUO78394.1 hypothetical protein CWI83_05025 [Pseudidiomarina taiwanensis]
MIGSKMEKSRFIYIGAFRLPDRNAAAHRVLNIGKAIRELGGEVSYIHEGRLVKIADVERVENSEPEAKSSFQKASILFRDFICGLKHVLHRNCTHIIVYNLPVVFYVPIFLVAKFSRVKVIADCTEWYDSLGDSVVKKLMKQIDVSCRMRVLNKFAYRVISISSLLNKYYQRNSILIPPLIDIQDSKWLLAMESSPPNGVAKKKINLFYGGDMGEGKDSLFDILYFLANEPSSIKSSVNIIIAGDITPKVKSEIQQYAYSLSIVFVGRIQHTAVLEYLSHCDYLVFFRKSTRANNAGFPTKFTEAFTMGVNIITNSTSDIGNFAGFENVTLVDKPSQMSNLDLSIKDKKNRISELNDYFDYRNYLAEIERLI